MTIQCSCRRVTSSLLRGGLTLSSPYTVYSMTTESVYTTATGDALTIVERPAAGIGHKLWDCSRVTARYLEANSRKLPIRNKRWIELGAGCGLLGQVLALLGAREVVLTDLPELVDNLRSQVRRNVGDAKKVTVRELTWGKTDVSSWEAFDAIIAGDVIYQMEQVPLLVQTLCELAKLHTGTGPAIYVTGEVRCPYTHEAFIKAASEHFTISPVSLKKQLAGTEFKEDDIFLLHLKPVKKA